MKYQLSFLSTPSSDTSLALALTFPSAKYFFAASEALTRTLVQRKTGVRKLRAVFLGEASEGGLAGLLMTVGDTGGGQVVVGGPPGTEHRLAGMRYYTRRDYLSLVVSESPLPSPTTDLPPPLYKDDLITVFSHTSSAPLSPPPPPSPPRRSSSPPPPHTLRGAPASAYRQRILSELFPGLPPPTNPGSQPLTSEEAPDPSAGGNNTPARRMARQPAPIYPRSGAATSYLVVGPDVRGKFDVKAADALGVPKNERSKLTRGESVVVKGREGERVVKPEEVLGEGSKGTVFAILNVPTPAHIPSLLSSPLWPAYRDRAHLVVHNLGPGVLEDTAYVEWLNSAWDAGTHHLLATPTHSPNLISFPSSYLSLLRSSHLSSTFSLPLASSSPTAPLPPSLPEKAQLAHPSHVLEMTPPGAPTAAEGEKEGQMDVRVGLREGVWEEFQRLAGEAKARVAEEREARKESEKGPGDDVVVTALGTGSALPSKYRNVSGTLLQLPLSRTNVLLDAGEGTWGQLARRFGERVRGTGPVRSPFPAKEGEQEVEMEDAWDVLRKTRLVYVSHVHADHHIGVAKLLKHRATIADAEPLYLIANQLVRTYLLEQDELEPLGIADGRVLLIDVEGLEWRVNLGGWDRGMPGWKRAYVDEAQRHLPGLLEALKLKSCRTALVQHRAKTFGLVLEPEDGGKIVYSGDTVPCQNLVDAGRGATLLVHEATMEDGMEEMAAAKGHSTIGQAIDIGTRMQASHLLLTHFSQRYPKFPRISPPAPTSSGPSDPSAAAAPVSVPIIAHAFDLFTSRVGDLWEQAHYVDALSLLFAEDPEAEADADAVAIEDALPGAEAERQQQQSKKASKKAEKKQGKKEAAAAQRQKQKMSERSADADDGLGQQPQGKRARTTRDAPAPTPTEEKPQTQQQQQPKDEASTGSVGQAQG